MLGTTVTRRMASRHDVAVGVAAVRRHQRRLGVRRRRGPGRAYVAYCVAVGYCFGVAVALLALRVLDRLGR